MDKNTLFKFVTTIRCQREELNQIQNMIENAHNELSVLQDLVLDVCGLPADNTTKPFTPKEDAFCRDWFDSCFDPDEILDFDDLFQGIEVYKIDNT